MFLVWNRKSEQCYWILHIRVILGTKFQFKVTILTFFTKFVQIGHFQSKAEKKELHRWVLHIRISLGTKFQLKLIILNFWNFRPKTEKSHLYVRPWTLLTILSFFRTGAGRHNSILILMPLILLVAETKTNWICNTVQAVSSL